MITHPIDIPNGPRYLEDHIALARLLAFRAEYFADSHDSAECLRSGLDAVELGQVMAGGGRLLDSAYGHNCASVGRVPIWRHIETMRDIDCRVGILRLERIETERVPLVDTLREEKACVLIGLMKAFHDPAGWKIYANDRDPDERDRPSLLGVWYEHALIPSKRTVWANCNSRLNALIDAAGQPAAAYKAEVRSDPFTDQVVWGFRVIQYNAVAIAGNRLLLTALALRAYRLEHGAFPRTLSTLTPAYLKDIPGDPFAAGAPLRYRQMGSGYVLYSVGPDGKDDGGVPIATRSSESPHMVQPSSKNDIVAGVNNG